LCGTALFQRKDSVAESAYVQAGLDGF
jgi:hypothetical protein